MVVLFASQKQCDLRFWPLKVYHQTVISLPASLPSRWSPSVFWTLLPWTVQIFKRVKLYYPNTIITTSLKIPLSFIFKCFVTKLWCGTKRIKQVHAPLFWIRCIWNNTERPLPFTPNIDATSKNETDILRINLSKFLHTEM